MNAIVVLAGWWATLYFAPLFSRPVFALQRPRPGQDRVSLPWRYAVYVEAPKEVEAVWISNPVSGYFGPDQGSVRLDLAVDGPVRVTRYRPAWFWTKSAGHLVDVPRSLHAPVSRRARLIVCRNGDQPAFMTVVPVSRFGRLVRWVRGAEGCFEVRWMANGAKGRWYVSDFTGRLSLPWDSTNR